MVDFLLYGLVILGAAFGYRMKLLTRSGSIAAAGVGILTYVGLHFQGLLLLGTFFLTSSYWSKYKKVQKQKVEEMLAKGSQRDWQQVLANGGGAAAASFLYAVNPLPIWIVAFCTFLASSNSDTWASEVGTLSRKRPLSIRNFTFVPKGTSGAVSLLGTGAGACGAMLMAMLALFLFPISYATALIIFLFGFFGNVVDTILGAFFQASYRCQHCRLETEKLEHCGMKTTKVRGYSILNNDLVNFLSGFIAAVSGVMVYSWLSS